MSKTYNVNLMDREKMLPIFHSRFSLFLREAIDRDGKKPWTNRKMADRLGLSENSVSSIKGGHSLPSTGTLHNIAEMFGGTTGQLLGREDFRPPSSKPTATVSIKPSRGKKRRIQ